MTSPCQPESTPPRGRLPHWLKVRVPEGAANRLTAGLVEELGLATVCDHARCPNRMECYARKTATFMILGRQCTRNCAFCSVAHGEPEAVDPDEPRRVAEAARRLGLRHLVVTCVTRDDLADGGAEHFCQTIAAVRAVCAATIEVLPSDLGGNGEALARLIGAAPDVYNYNVETVPRLFSSVRGPRLDYRWTLETFRRIKRANPAIRTKTGMMLGLGETRDEVLDVLAELHEAGCELLTLGQYLQPSPAQMAVVRYVPPEEFDELGELARAIGFAAVASGPFVRSSYHAGEMVERG
ncbi:MAG: lipoyl synthase [Pirellulales bacterium]|nr:lipoyl synthase [Pirellulales bacterium]